MKKPPPKVFSAIKVIMSREWENLIFFTQNVKIDFI